MCAALRRGDGCRLRWNDADLKSGSISVKTAKIGVRVEIPIWPLLREVLIERQMDAAGEYVFPEQAQMYERDCSCVSLRAKKVPQQAGFYEGAMNNEHGPSSGKQREKLHGQDFHSFRVTLITMALAQGVPIELVQRVAGHSVVGAPCGMAAVGLPRSAIHHLLK
jgi:integrase